MTDDELVEATCQCPPHTVHLCQTGREVCVFVDVHHNICLSTPTVEKVEVSFGERVACAPKALREVWCTWQTACLQVACSPAQKTHGILAM